MTHNYETKLTSLDETTIEADVIHITAGEQTIKVPTKGALLSKFIATLLGECGTNRITLTHVKPYLLESICQYMTHHAENPVSVITPPLKSNKMSDSCSAFDANFIDEIDAHNERTKLYDLVMAAVYLDMEPLTRLGLAKIASLIKGKPLDQFKDILTAKTMDTREPCEQKS